ncbi:hypothetical protein [Nocardia sp. NPDC050406]|uniref:DUF7822 domain-containing protein n=1 Tax=Nocardia sp. NPDC050406 TaxID=3364318 RepID=UPI0037A5CB65
MANRSYLYSVDSLPSAENLPKPIKCVSEHNWAIPLAHRLLVGYETQVVPSMIWNPRIGVVGDYVRGGKLLISLMTEVGKAEFPERDEFLACMRATLVHLSKQKAAYFLLETGEIHSLTEEDVEAAVEGMVGDIADDVKRAEAAIAGGEPEWVESLRANWREHFDSFYSDWLYFSFPRD